MQRLCATIVGLVFLLAGIFKIFDPVGAGLVLEEYFRLVHLDFLLPVAKPLAVAVAFAAKYRVFARLLTRTS